MAFFPLLLRAGICLIFPEHADSQEMHEHHVNIIKRNSRNKCLTIFAIDQVGRGALVRTMKLPGPMSICLMLAAEEHSCAWDELEGENAGRFEMWQRWKSSGEHTIVVPSVEEATAMLELVQSFKTGGDIW